MGFLDFVKDVVNVVMTPFKAVFETITGAISEATQQNIENIEGAVGLDPSDIGNFAKGVVGAGGDLLHGVADAGSSVLRTGENLATGAGNTIFGLADSGKYIMYGLLAIGGIFLVNNADKILDIGDRRINR